MKKWLFCIAYSFIVVALTSPSELDAGFWDKARQKADAVKESTKRKYEQTKRSVDRRVQKKKDRDRQRRPQPQRSARKKMERFKDSAKKNYQRKKEAFQSKYNSRKEATEENWKRRKQYTRQQLKNTYDRSRNKMGNVYDIKSTQFKADFGRAKSKFGREAVRLVDYTVAAHGPTAGRAVASYLSKAKKYNEVIIRNSQGVMNKIRDNVRDPKKREKAMHAAILASAVAYYGYAHKNDLKYKAVRYGLQHVSVNVNGRHVSAEEAISSAILRQAPYLRGTRLAEDPAALLTYGVTSIATDDLMNNLAIIPDGSGEMRSINQSLHQVEGADDAIRVLQVSTSMEGMAMSAAENGNLGRYGEDFVASYKNMEGQFGE